MRIETGKRVIAFLSVLGLLAVGISPPVFAGWKGWLNKVTQKAKNKSKNKRKVSHRNVSAVRGLSEGDDAEEQADDRDFEGLEWLESIEITEQELETFVREGRLAP